MEEDRGLGYCPQSIQPKASTNLPFMQSHGPAMVPPAQSGPADTLPELHVHEQINKTAVDRVVWKGFPAFPAHLRMRPISRGNSSLPREDTSFPAPGTRQEARLSRSLRGTQALDPEAARPGRQWPRSPSTASGGFSSFLKKLVTESNYPSHEEAAPGNVYHIGSSSLVKSSV